MSAPGEPKGGDREPDPAGHIRRDAARKRRSLAHPPPSPLRGFGTFGMIGWSVAVPGVGGALVGTWLDTTLPQAFSWTLALLLGGIVVGALLAWGWVQREARDDALEHARAEARDEEPPR